MPLSPQELRQALNPGPFTTFADEYSIESKGIKQVLKLKKPDYRMRDVEIVVRFFAFKNFIENYNGKLKEFLDSTCETLNNEWEKDPKRIKIQAQELEDSIRTTFEIFGENAFTKYSNGNFTGIFNRPVYDIMTYFFSNNDISQLAISKKQDVFDSFVDLCTKDIDFVRSLETSTKNVDPTAKRFNTWGCELSRITGLKFPMPTRADVGIKIA